MWAKWAGSWDWCRWAELIVPPIVGVARFGVVNDVDSLGNFNCE